jgi:AAA15 family ATPase/GTPase
MLIRFLVKNLFSFKELTEFNMLPGRFNRLPHHVYKSGEVSILKLNTIYGGNGAGKSNLINSIALLREFVKQGNMPIEFLLETFKLNPQSADEEIYLGIEFIKDNYNFYYDLSIKNGIIYREELIQSIGNDAKDEVLFSRSFNDSINEIELTFAPVIMNDIEVNMFTKFLKEEILEADKPVLFYMSTRKNAAFDKYRKAQEWFAKDLIPILPNYTALHLPLLIESLPPFRDFALNVMQTFNTGIKSINIETIPIEEFLGEDERAESEKITSQLRQKFKRGSSPRITYKDVNFVLENDQAFAKTLYFLHENDSHQTKFTLDEESDGTLRLLDYLPVLFNLINSNKVYIIDEIERSIHPVLIKELIKKFSHDPNTKGQLIFSTHESNLLDQEIFRPDEIWFAEKNNFGATELHVLSEFKEHHTIDIRKGYLNGRYGGIPFLGNLIDLNWDKYAEAN